MTSRDRNAASPPSQSSYCAAHRFSSSVQFTTTWYGREAGETAAIPSSIPRVSVIMAGTLLNTGQENFGRDRELNGALQNGHSPLGAA